MRTTMAKLKGAFLQLPITITLKTLASWRIYVTYKLCIYLAIHFVRILSCFIIFTLPFSTVALAFSRLTLIGAMSDHWSVLGSYRSAVLSVEWSAVRPPITYSTSSSTASQWPNLERKITYFVMFYVSLVLIFICCWHIDFPSPKASVTSSLLNRNSS
jgi:hypothetical protein